MLRADAPRVIRIEYLNGMNEMTDPLGLPRGTPFEPPWESLLDPRGDPFWIPLGIPFGSLWGPLLDPLGAPFWTP